MRWRTTNLFLNLSGLILILFLVQVLQPSIFGYRLSERAEHGLSAIFGISTAQAQGNPGDLLASTPDADITDPVIIDKANELGNAPGAIFEFVREEIGYESYVGSLRGARGTLWNGAGNALDQASLLIALLRVSGIPARYARGTLVDDQAKELILSMFPEPLRVVGFVPDGVERADPANDAKLLGETRDHFWVEADLGGFQTMDPTFFSARIGDAFAGVQSTFTEVADGLRHKVTIRLMRELTNLATGLFGLPGQEVATVLEATFNAVEVVGKPLSIGHLVEQKVLPNPVFTSVTNNYAPYIAVGDFNSPIAQDDVIGGTGYQEVITSFPFGSQILTGVFLEIDLSGPDGPMETFERTLLDRIGFDIRQNGGSPNLTFAADDPPALTPLDVFGVHVVTGKIPTDLGEPLSEELQTLQDELKALQNSDGSFPAGAGDEFTRFSIGVTRMNGANYFTLSDFSTARVADMLLVRAYTDKPRIIVSSIKLEGAGNGGSATATMRLDLRRNQVRALAHPGQNPSAVPVFNMTRGFRESAVETAVMQSQLTQGGVSRTVISAATVIQAASEQGLLFPFVTSDDLFQLDELQVSAEASERIRQTLEADQVVLIPERAVEIDGIERIAWYQIDPVTGETIGVTEDGGHQAIVEYAAALAHSSVLEGILTGLAINAVFIAGTVIFNDNCSGSPEQRKACKDFIRGPGNNPVDALNSNKGQAEAAFKVGQNALGSGGGIVGGFGGAAGVAGKFVGGGLIGAILNLYLTNFLLKDLDPPAPEFLVFPEIPDDNLTNLTGTGLVAKIVPDSLFTLPAGGALLPTVFRVGIKNGSASADRFSVSAVNVPAGFEAVTSVAEIGVPAGNTAEVGLALRPAGNPPPPGTNLLFGVQAASTTNAILTVTANQSFTVPDIPGLTLAAAPDAVSTTPGTSVSVTLTIQSVGNVPENVTFDLQTPAGLSVAGLTPVSLAVGETQAIPLTLTPDSSTPLDSTLVATITANFGASESQVLTIPVRVTVPGADAIVQAAVAAADLGNANLANRLDALATALNNLVQDAADPVAKTQVLAELDSILSLLANDSDLAAFVPDIETARDELVSAATAAEIQAAISALGAALDDFGTAAVNAIRHNVQIHLTPNQQVSQPLVSATFQVLLHNVGSETTTYDLTVTGVPAGVTAQFSQNQVTLDRDQLSSGLMLTLTPNATSEIAVFDFQVAATAAGTSFSRSASGALSARSEFVSVTEVTASPPFLDAGGSVNVSTRVLNAVNRQQDVLVSYQVKDPSGAQVFASAPVQAQLTTQTSLLDVDLGALDTTGFAQGNHTLDVTVTDPGGNPIPGGSGQGTLLIGSPVTASLTVAPQLLPPGNGMVTNSLQVDSGANAGAPFELAGQLSVTAFNNDVLNGIELNDDIAYVFGNGGIHVVDITDPTAPAFVRTADLNAPKSFGRVVNGQLFAMHTGFPSGIAIFSNSALRTFDLSGIVGGSADNPVGRGTLFPNYQFMANFVVSGNHLFAGYNQVRLNIGAGDVTAQTGTVLSFDIGNPASPLLADALFDTNGTMGTGPLFLSGGDFNVFDVERADADTLLVASTTATGTDTQTGVGRMLVVDITDPADINSDPPNPSKIVAELDIPGTVHVHGIALDGDLAFLVGSQGGWRDPFVVVEDIGPTGDLVLATVDISDPRNPQLIHTQTLNRAARGGGADLIALGNRRFAFSSLGALSDDPQLFVVDAGDANDPVITIQLDVPTFINGLRTDGSFLYASGADGLSVYRLGGSPIPVTARVRVPNNTGVTVDTTSFTTPPDQTVADTDFDTLVWNLSQSATITWESAVTNLQPGEARPVTQGGTVDFTVNGIAGQVTLPPTSVTAEQILGITPATQTVQPGVQASYTLMVKNPAGSPVTYDLAVQGVPSSWVELASSVDIPAGGQADVPLVLGPDAFAVLGDYGFSVSAGTGGTTGSVQATLILEGDAVLPAAAPNARGIVAALTPQRLVTGQGSVAVYRLRLTNAGSASDIFQPTVSLPPGFAGEFSLNAVAVPPGAGNFREILLTVTPLDGTPAGDAGFEVTIVSATNSAVKDQVSGIVAVSGLGVDVMLQAPNPNVFQMTVTNTGQNTDTFDLTLAGPLAPFASLETTVVTLQPGQSQAVPISLQAIDFAIPGVLVLTGVATSRTDDQVRDHDDASINIAASQGVSADFDPRVVTLQEPGKAGFLLLIQNTGNVEDSYSAAITSTSPNVSADLMGLDGQPTQSIPRFILPGLASGVIQLDANLDDGTQGTVTVAVSSLNHAGVMSAPSAFISAIRDAVQQIPTLSEWAKLLLAFLLLLLFGWMLKRRSGPRSGLD